MGRKLRRVPANWQHPTDKDGRYIPLLKGFSEAANRWDEESQQWAKGMRSEYDFDTQQYSWVPIEDEFKHLSYVEWTDQRPKPEDYMPEWPEEELTHIQLYENTTEGTPQSPVFPANEIEALCEYAAKHVSVWGYDQFRAKEEWMRLLLPGAGPEYVQIDSNTIIIH